MSVPTPKRKLNRVLLVGSLALNVLLVGLIAGSVLTGNAGPPRGFDAQLGPITEFMSSDERREIGRDLRREINAAGIPRPDRNAAFDTIADMLEADSFDTAAFVASIEAQQSGSDAIRQIAVRTIATHISQMPVAERRDLAVRLRERQSERRGGKG